MQKCGQPNAIDHPQYQEKQVIEKKQVTIRTSFLSTFDALVYYWIYHIIISITVSPSSYQQE